MPPLPPTAPGSSHGEGAPTAGAVPHPIRARIEAVVAEYARTLQHATAVQELLAAVQSDVHGAVIAALPTQLLTPELLAVVEAAPSGEALVAFWARPDVPEAVVTLAVARARRDLGTRGVARLGTYRLGLLAQSPHLRAAHVQQLLDDAGKHAADDAAYAGRWDQLRAALEAAPALTGAQMTRLLGAAPYYPSRAMGLLAHPAAGPEGWAAAEASVPTEASVPAGARGSARAGAAARPWSELDVIGFWTAIAGHPRLDRYPDWAGRVYDELLLRGRHALLLELAARVPLPDRAATAAHVITAVDRVLPTPGADAALESLAALGTDVLACIPPADWARWLDGACRAVRLRLVGALGRRGAGGPERPTADHAEPTTGPDPCGPSEPTSGRPAGARSDRSSGRRP